VAARAQPATVVSVSAQAAGGVGAGNSSARGCPTRAGAHASSAGWDGNALLAARWVDCDAGNVGMFRAFRRAGYRNFANRKMFSRPL